MTDEDLIRDFEDRQDEKAATIELPAGEWETGEPMTPLARILDGGALELTEDRIVEGPWRCELCRDRGWTLQPDGGSGTAVRCACATTINREQVREALIYSGMRRGEIEVAYGAWDESHQPKPVFAKEWLAWVLTGAPVETMPPYLTESNQPPDEPWILTLMGKTGRGKTKTAATLARIFSEGGGRRMTWANATESFDRVQKERHAEGASNWEDRIIEAGLLVIDDFGVVHRRDGETMDGTIANWLYQRFRRQTPTILTTNAESMGDLRETRVASRIAAGIYRGMKSETDYRDWARR